MTIMRFPSPEVVVVMHHAGGMLNVYRFNRGESSKAIAMVGRHARKGRFTIVEAKEITKLIRKAEKAGPLP